MGFAHMTIQVAIFVETYLAIFALKLFSKVFKKKKNVFGIPPCLGFKFKGVCKISV